MGGLSHVSVNVSPDGSEIENNNSRELQSWVDVSRLAWDHCLNQLPAVTAPQAGDRIQQILTEIYDAPDLDWSAAHIAQRLGCSEVHAGRLFRRSGLQSPMNEVTRIRVQRAARFIRYSDMNLQEIAIRVGFATFFAIASI